MAPSCAPSTPIIDEASQQASVAACLGRLRRATGHFQAKRLAFEIRDVGFTPAGTLGTLQILVRWIFERAIGNPDRYAAPCAALCFSLTPILPTFKPPGVLTAAAKAKRIDFRQTLLNLCQQQFEEACSTAFSEASEFLPPPAAAAASDEIDEGMGDEAVAATPAASLHGSLQFLAHLYMHHLLTDRIMLSCLVAVSSREAAAAGSSSSRNGGGGGGGGALLSGRGVSLRVECLVRALLIAGRQLDECLAEQYRPQLDELYGQLAVCDKAHAASMSGMSVHDLSAPVPLRPEVHILLAQLLELRAGRWMNGGGGGGGVAAAPGTASTANGFPGSRTSTGAATPSAAVAAAAATAAAKLGKGAGVVTVHRSSGRLVMAAPVAASAISSSSAAASPADASPPMRRASTSTSTTAAVVTGGGSVAGSSQSPAAAVAAAVTTALLRRQQLGHAANGSSGSLLFSRSSSHNQNLEGLWDLSSDTYNDVRGQLLSQPVETSPATLEAMADEIVESAVAASGGDPSCPCWYENDDATEVRALTHGSMLGSTAATGPTPPRTLLTDAKWSELMCQQWDEQVAACEIYVRLCMDALQQMSSVTPVAASVVPMPVTPVSEFAGAQLRMYGPDVAATASSCCDAAESAGAGGNSVAAAPAATDAATTVVGDTGRAFRRALLSAAQTHFERCLAALLPVPPSPSRVSDTPMLPSKQAAVPMSLEADSGGAGGNGVAASVESRRAWGDMPAVAANASSALPRARGICHLLLGLLRKGILTPRIVLHCAAALVDGAAVGSVACLQCACILLAGSGEQFQTLKNVEAAAFEVVLKRLQGLAVTNEAAAGKLCNVTADGSSPITTVSSSSNDDGGLPSGSSKPSGLELASQNQLLLRRRFTSWLTERLREKH
ncbi:hypothetical protein VaNZ11_011361 [Volvox africanus]|uniref:MIF4G domain-containing protein n=1 Tax=Volvox africanus TaxID=51714 RepID=A0ABQ5SBX9_9CHLO|nr:hypothetical protein VaNZ11_011361 [Volvox africanus]